LHAEKMMTAYAAMAVVTSQVQAAEDDIRLGNLKLAHFGAISLSHL
jgi:hypothetical protein